MLAFLTMYCRHEIVGKAVRVGSKVKGVKVGDRVGVGAQIGSCYDCKDCNNANENYCPKQIDTYVCQQSIRGGLLTLNNPYPRTQSILMESVRLVATQQASSPTSNSYFQSLMPFHRRMRALCFALD